VWKPAAPSTRSRESSILGFMPASDLETPDLGSPRAPALEGDAARAALLRALERWRRTTVRDAVAEARADERLLLRVEAEDLARRVRLLAGGEDDAPAPPRSPRRAPGVVSAPALFLDEELPPAGDPLARIRYGLSLQGGLVAAIASEAGDRPGAAALVARASQAIAARTQELWRHVSRGRAVLGEALVSLRATFQNLPNGLVFLDCEGVVVDVNRWIVERTGLGREQIVGRRHEEVWPDALATAVRARYARVIRTGKTETVYGVTYRPQGAAEPWVFDLVITPRAVGGQLVGTTSIVHDRTVHTRLQRRLERADRLASVGRLAAGVGHELRNLLAGVRALAELGEADPARATASLARIIRVADEATELAGGLFSFSRRETARLHLVRLDTLLHEAVDLALGGGKRRRIRVTIDASADLPRLRCDRDEVRRALLNVVRNSVQALGPGGGSLELRARCVGDGVGVGEGDGEGADSAAGDAGAVELSVTDDGPGLDAALWDQVFEPFVTTRRDEVGDAAGVGLGLSLVKAVCERHGGGVRLERPAAGGLRVVLRLPLCPGEEAERRDRVAREAAAPSRVPAAHELGGVLAARPGARRPRALVLDDAPVLREIVAEVLGRAGLEVSQTDELDEARAVLEQAEAAGAPIAVAILDLVVPGLDGVRSLEALRIRFPDLKIAILTGQALSHDALQDVLRFSDAFLEKPFRVGEIVETVRGLLRGAVAGGKEAPLVV